VRIPFPNSVPQGRLKKLSEFDLKNASVQQPLFHPAAALSLQRPSPFCHPERSRGICSSADLSWKRGKTKGGWCFHEDSVIIGGGCGPAGAGHTNGALQIPRLPRISCRQCRFGQLHVVLFKENHISGRWRKQ
jgi:hypothetical protein